MAMSFKPYNDVTGRHEASVQLFILYLSLGLVRLCEMEISHMGKNNGNLHLVCEKIFSQCLLKYKCNGSMQSFLTLHVAIVFLLH